ncbi:MAG TPA: carbohydrate-binding domain-containing protein [Candidatus Limnocylindria bacterium]|nr:carbohydrate-binding domain-containing protein [Candidatus Limnocylindria bacterium]
MMRKLLALFAAFLALPLLAPGAGLAAENEAAYYSAEDLVFSYDAASAHVVDLSGQDGYEITGAGTWVLGGGMRGQLVIRAAKGETVRVVLDNASVTNPDGPALFAEGAGKVILTLAEGTENNLSDGEDYDEDEAGGDAAVWVKGDLTVNGKGALTVRGMAAHGIRSGGVLAVAGGSISVTAVNDGLRGKDGAAILGGALDIGAGSDGIVSDSGKAGRGWVRVEGGSVVIRARRDGIQAEGDLSVSGGELDITTGGGGREVTFAAAPQEDGGAAQGGMRAEDAPEYAGESAKGLKAKRSVTVSGGTIMLSSADDGIHSDGDVTVLGGALTILSGDDGVHAGGNLRIAGGDVTVLGSAEGLEARTVSIEGGTVAIRASEDGVNAASPGFKGDGSAQDGVWVKVSGGTLRVVAGKDGIDSNGDITISGGVVDLTVWYPGGGNSAIDPNGVFTHTGGQVTTSDGSENAAPAPGGRP